jgi:hypothetical protein
MRRDSSKPCRPLQRKSRACIYRSQKLASSLASCPSRSFKVRSGDLDLVSCGCLIKEDSMANPSGPPSALQLLLTEHALRLMAGAASFEQWPTVCVHPKGEEAEHRWGPTVCHRARNGEVPGPDTGP